MRARSIHIVRLVYGLIKVKFVVKYAKKCSVRTVFFIITFSTKLYWVCFRVLIVSN